MMSDREISGTAVSPRSKALKYAMPKPKSTRSKPSPKSKKVLGNTSKGKSSAASARKKNKLVIYR